MRVEIVVLTFQKYFSAHNLVRFYLIVFDVYDSLLAQVFDFYFVIFPLPFIPATPSTLLGLFIHTYLVS